MTRPASEKGRRLVASYGEARDLLPDTAVAVEHSHTALLAYVAALETVARDARALEDEFGGWWLSAPSNEPLGKLRDSLAALGALDAEGGGG